MAQQRAFHYHPLCTTPGCEAPAVYKIAASWSDGSSRELKNYGLACEQHRDDGLSAARRHHRELRRADDETVGPVALYHLLKGCRDQDLEPIA